MLIKDKKFKYDYMIGLIDTGSFVLTLTSEIKNQVEPLFNLWTNKSTSEFIVTFNMIRILLPILEDTSRIEFNKNVPVLLEKLGVPFPEISWVMFRHGLSHTIRPFIVEKDGIQYSWGIKYFDGEHSTNSENLIIISPVRLLSDLKKYLDTIQYKCGNTKIQIGTKIV